MILTPCDPIPVPYGKRAFFPGMLRHTNELVVGLGCGYRAECTASHAAGILSRRKEAVGQNIAEVEAEIQGLRDRLKLTGTEMQQVVRGGGPGGGVGSDGCQGGSDGGPEEGEGQFEIRETYEESEALLSSARRPAASSSSSLHEASSGDGQRQPKHQGQPRKSPLSSATVSKEIVDDDDGHLDRVFARMADLERLEAQQELEQAEGKVGAPGSKGSTGTTRGASKMPSGSQGNPKQPALRDDEVIDMFAPVPITASLGGLPPSLPQAVSGDGSLSALSHVADAGPSQEVGENPSPAVPSSSAKSFLKKGFLVNSSSASVKKKAPSPGASSLGAGNRSVSATWVTEQRPSPSPPAASGPLGTRGEGQGASTDVPGPILPPAQRAFCGPVREHGLSLVQEPRPPPAGGPGSSSSSPGPAPESKEASRLSGGIEGAVASGHASAASEEPQGTGATEKKVSKFKMQRAAAKGVIL